MKPHAAIVATGAYVPPREVPNDALRARFGAEVIDKLEAASGIRTRWYAPDDWATSDLAAAASRIALERAGVLAEDLDLVLVGTDSPDFVTPCTSVVVQHELGARRAGTFDVGCACASFPTAIATASALMESNPRLENVLVVGAYLMHRLAAPDDPMVFFYGDGAGAALLRRSEVRGVFGAAFRADGRYARHWGIFAGGTAEPATVDAVAAGRARVRLLERYPPEVNEEGWPLLVREVAARSGLPLAEFDHIIFTQVRKQTIERVMQTLALPIERAPMIMGKWGYTGSACIPMALDDALRHGRIRGGDRVVLVGSGVGYNQCAVAIRAP